MVRRDLPVGTVTFLFTDVEGSTRLLHELGAAAYADALAEHRRLVREECELHGGVEVDTQGDAFFVAFPTAPGALDAAGAITRGLAAGSLEVRIGIHTGIPLATDEGYVGLDVHRAARIAASGHGGQVLVSASTADLVSGYELRDLGEHRFKDLAAPERVYQLGDGDFPRLRSLFHTNLPVLSTSFLGREREVREVVELLQRDDVNLLTLTGPGGTGKTRLALQAAAEASDRYPDGVWWVPLSPLRDPALILTVVAQALEVKEEPGTPIGETLRGALTGSRRVLLLDNVEHLLPDAADAIAVLRVHKGPVILATSRERLQLTGEHLYPVPTLDEPDAVELFAARARALVPTFVPDASVAELCGRLDNLPLAIELAAARTIVFSPEGLVERLMQRLDLLKAGRDADPRQRTLRATIEWSFDLLGPDEQRLFRRLSVFAGGCSYEAAEDVCGADPDTLQSLLDKSLVRRRDSEVGSRFWMLETIREFARERLHECSEAEGCMRRLLEHLSLVAEAEEPRLSTSEQTDAVRRLESEHDNVRAALGWALAHGSADLALRLSAAMGRFWVMADHVVEGGRWIEEVLERSDGTDRSLRARALVVAGSLAHYLDDQDRAEARYDEARLLAEQLDEQLTHAYALSGLGNVADERDQVELAVRLNSAALEHFRAVGDERGIRVSLTNLGERAMRLGDAGRARALLDEAVARSRAAHDAYVLTASLETLGVVALNEGDPDSASTIYRELLHAALAGGFKRHVAYGVAGLSAVASLKGAVARSGFLWGALERMEDDLGFPIHGTERVRYERHVRRIEASDPAAFASAIRDGRAVTSDEAIARALDTQG